MAENVQTIEHDIAELERQIQEKKTALEYEKSEKDILHGIVGEKIQQQAPQYRPVPPAPAVFQPASPPPQDLKDKVQEAISLVFDKNLEEGIKKAASHDNIALLDDFHDTLVDELYNQLIENKKLAKVE